MWRRHLGALEVAKAARSSRRLADDLDERMVPLADKADVSVDAFNAELLRVDLILDQVEDAVNRFTGTAETVRGVVDAPIHLVTEMAERFRSGLRRRGTHPSEPGAATQRPDNEAGVTVVLADGSDEEITESGGTEWIGGSDTVSTPPEPAAEGETEPVADRAVESAQLGLKTDAESEQSNATTFPSNDPEDP